MKLLLLSISGNRFFEHILCFFLLEMAVPMRDSSSTDQYRIFRNMLDKEK